ncbi:MAG: ribonuclease HI [Xanthomonadales bacterium]|nr:ribonuclease HI [Xanthomonadales bacterium]
MVVHTDGACSGNPGPGGWGAILRAGQHERTLSGHAADTTNNRMELMAAIAALEALRRPCRVRLHTDSKYVQQGLQDWLPRWRRSGFKTSAGAPVKNQDLWLRLEAAAQPHQLELIWVRGHAGDPGNEAADSLAREALQRGLAEGGQA